MYESKYSKYITETTARFASEEEIKEVCRPLRSGAKNRASGAVLYYEDGVLYVDDSDSHYYIQGGTGSKKTRTQGVTVIKTIISSGESCVINDPKGELYRRTAGLAKKRGYKVRVLNFRDTSKSHGWNPLMLVRAFERAGDTASAEQALGDFKEAMIGPCLSNTADRFWPDTSGQVIKYCAELLQDSVPDEALNIANLIQLTHEGNGDSLRVLLGKMDPNSNTAISMRGVLDLRAEKTTSCIYSTVKQALIPLNENKGLRTLLCSNEIDFEDLVEGKTVIYVIYPDEKRALGFLVNLFFTQCYQYLVSRSVSMPHSHLKIRVNFVLDEFGNLPAVDSFENRISEARGHNIRFFLFGQSFGQLKAKYKENAETILANCDWIIFPSKDIAFFETLSRMCGRTVDYYGRECELISACDIQHLRKTKEGAEVIIMKSGQYPFVTMIPDYEYIDIFEECPEEELEVIEHETKPMFLTFSEWFNNLGTKFNFPFPIGGRIIDLRK